MRSGTRGKSNGRSRARCLLIHWLAIALFVAFGPGAVSAQDRVSLAPRQNYAIPADRLDKALASFAAISDVDILYDNALAAGRRSTAVSGRYSPPQALAILLSGTGLSWRFTKTRAVVIFAVGPGASGPSRAADPYPMLTLDTLQVRVSPIIGGPSRAPFMAYSNWVLSELYRLIQPNRDEQNRAFRGEVQFWINAEGVVHRLEFLKRTGDPEADRLIESRISGADFERPPPPGLPQPLRFVVEGRK